MNYANTWFCCFLLYVFKSLLCWKLAALDSTFSQLLKFLFNNSIIHRSQIWKKKCFTTYITVISSTNSKYYLWLSWVSSIRWKICHRYKSTLSHAKRSQGKFQSCWNFSLVTGVVEISSQFLKQFLTSSEVGNCNDKVQSEIQPKVKIPA